MAVLITCKSERDSIKNEITIVRTRFHKSMRPQGRVILMPIVKTGQKSNLFEILCLFLLSASLMKIRSNDVAVVRTTFPNYFSREIKEEVTFGISLPEEDIDLPKLYWIPKLHKNPYKQRYIAGSAKCSTKPLSQILTRILTAVKEGLQKYCGTAYAISGVNQMWILKNSKELLENLKAQSLHSVNSIKSFDFSTRYTTIPHDKLKSKVKEIINQCFFHKNGNRRFQYVVIGYKDTYFVRDHSDAPQEYSDADVIKMLERC